VAFLDRAIPDRVAGCPDRLESPVKLGQYLGYGAGDAANNLTFSMVSAFLLISLSHPIRPSGITMQALCVKPRCGYPGWGNYAAVLV
jgi:hypothetical protein